MYISGIPEYGGWGVGMGGRGGSAIWGTVTAKNRKAPGEGEGEGGGGKFINTLYVLWSFKQCERRPCIFIHFSAYSKQLLNFSYYISQPEITFSKSKIETLEQGVKYVRRSGVFIVNFEYISHLVLVFLFLTLSR